MTCQALCARNGWALAWAWGGGGIERAWDASHSAAYGARLLDPRVAWLSTTLRGVGGANPAALAAFDALQRTARAEAAAAPPATWARWWSNLTALLPPRLRVRPIGGRDVYTGYPTAAAPPEPACLAAVAGTVTVAEVDVLDRCVGVNQMGACLCYA